MKKLLAAILLTAGIFGMSAQTQQTSEKATKSATTKIITGAVIDKNGNPVPGATVKATGGAETVVVDADGTFSIEVPVWLKSLTASYPGLGETKMKTNALNQMVITLKSRNRTYGFVNVVGQIRTQVGSTYHVPAQGEFGVMGGAYRSWGGYLKVVIRCVGRGIHYTHNEKHPEGSYTYTHDEKFQALPTTTFGAIKRLSNRFAIFFGAGVGFNYGGDDYACDGYTYNSSYDSSTGQYTSYETKDHDPHYEYAENSVTGVAEIGGLFKISNKLNVTAGVSYICPGEWIDNSGNLGIFLGVGLNI